MTQASYTAQYRLHHTEQSAKCGSLDDAVAFLAQGWVDGDLSQIAVLGPDGQVVLTGPELLDAMTDRLHG
jgi:hypothetical protein